jgi:Domain of unknown function (DUF4160)
MPVVFRQDGFRFFFYSKEGDPLEPLHIHVLKSGAEAKFWLRENVRMAYNYGFDFRTLRRLTAVIEEHRTEIEEAWNGHFT